MSPSEEERWDEPPKGPFFLDYWKMEELRKDYGDSIADSASDITLA